MPEKRCGNELGNDGTACTSTNEAYWISSIGILSIMIMQTEITKQYVGISLVTLLFYAVNAIFIWLLYVVMINYQKKHKRDKQLTV